MEAERIEPDRVAGDRARALRARLIAVWCTATLVGLGMAATTRIGPVLFGVSARHGVHLGDLLAFGVVYAVALTITLRTLAARSRSR